MNSIRERLLVYLIVPLILVVIGNLIWSQAVVGRTTLERFDMRLQQFVLTLAHFAPSSCIESISGSLGDIFVSVDSEKLHCKIVDESGRLVQGKGDIPDDPDFVPAQEEMLHFYDAEYDGEAIRVVAYRHYVATSEYDGWVTMTLSHTVLGRDSILHAVLTRDLIAGILQLLIVSITVFVAVTAGLRPLRRLARSVHNRDSQDLSAIKLADTPTEVEGITNELNDLLARVSSHIKLTKRFVENAAHQLRTPVAALLPQTQLAMREAESDREEQAIRKIQNSAERIARLTNQLLNLTRAENIRLSNERFEPVDLADVAERKATRFVERYPDKSLTKELASSVVMGIDLFIGEVIENLLDNVHAHAGPDAAIIIRTFDEAGFGVVEVEDDGPGIIESERDNVLERFYRASRETEGTGLGLAIVSEILAAHEGSVEIDAAPSGGCLIRCRFPASKVD